MRPFAPKVAFSFQQKKRDRCPALSPKEVKRALANLKGRHALRNQALLVLGVRSGLRISELLALRVGQVWDGEDVVSRFYVSRRHSKGKQSGSSIVMHPEAARVLTRWIKAGGLSQDLQGYLFPSQWRSGRLNRKSAWKILHRAFRRAGVTGMAGTHCMRKTFAGNIHQALGGDLFRTSKAMRHASPLTKLKYLSFKQEEIDRAILQM